MCVIATAALCLPAAQAPAFRIAFQRDGAQSDLWLVNSDGGGEEQLTRTPTPDAVPAWSGDGSTIVFACTPSGNWDLCTIDVNTRVVKQLTYTPTDEFDPQFTNDGQIVFETYPAGRNADIAIMPADGSGPARPLTSTPAADDQDPSPDPNSSRVAFASDGNVQMLDTSSGVVTPITSAKQGDTDPSFSSQGEIAFSRRSGRSHDILVANTEGAITRQLTSGKTEDLQPGFTQDGAQVAFARRTDSKSGFRIFVMDAGGQGQRPVTKGGTSDDTEPAVDPASAAAARWSALPVARLAAGCSTINGTGAGQTINGTAKANCIHAKGGNDTVNAKGGNDRVWGEAGRDTLNGSTGNDWFDATDGEQDVVNGGPGTDQAYIDDGLDLHASVTVH